MRLFRLLAATALVAFASSASAQEWGNIKGQVVLEGKIKNVVKVVVDKDQMHCLSKGDILSRKYVVDPKTKGVRWVMVWIAVEKEGKADHAAKLDVHKDLVMLKDPAVVVDQPCCMFEPHMIGLRKGQDFIGKNSSPIVHNMSLTSSKGPNVNQIIAAGGQMTIPAAKWTPHFLPVNVACGIHPWMNSKVFCFSHPYFAVTDEEGKFELKNVPAGKLRLIAWHEGMGWVVQEDGGAGKDGKGIEVKDKKTLDLPPIKLQYSKDD